MRNLFVQNQMKNQADQTKERKEKLEKRFEKIDWNVLHQSLIDHVIENEKGKEIDETKLSSVLSSLQKEKVKF